MSLSCASAKIHNTESDQAKNAFLHISPQRNTQQQKTAPKPANHPMQITPEMKLLVSNYTENCLPICF